MRKVVSLSLDDALHAQLIQTARQEGINLSQYARRLFMAGVETSRTAHVAAWPQSLVGLADSADATVIASCIIMYDNKVLIVKRRTVDARIPALRWTFPGGTLTRLAVTDDAARVVLERCGLRVRLAPISARYVPDVAPGQQPIAALYFTGESDTQNLRLSTSYVDARWVEPRMVFDHFSTSVSDDITHYLMAL